MRVAVCYATERQQFIKVLSLPTGSSVMRAILASGILDQFPDLDLVGNVGIFGKKVTLDQCLQDNDRVEIYRSLKLTPNQQRLLRRRK